MLDRAQQAPITSLADAYAAAARIHMVAISERVEARLKRSTLPLLALFGGFYLAAACYRASRKLLWFDETVTVYLSRLPDFPSLWQALTHGADFNSPLFYLLTKLGLALPVSDQIGARLPEIVGFGVFCLCLFRFVSMRSSALGGLVAMLFPLVTNAYWYAYEARPHGIVLGCCGVALVCWQAAAVQPRRRFWSLLGLGLALAIGVLNHAYAVLLFVPLATGEILRQWALRRIDWMVWITFLLASTACAVLILMAGQESGAASAGALVMNPWQLPAKVLEAYRGNLGPALLAIAGALVLFCSGVFIQPLRQPQPSPANTGPSNHELVVLWALLAIPVFAAGVSLLTRTFLFDRYSLSLVAGFAGLLGLNVARKPVTGLVLVVLLLAHIGIDQFNYVRGTTSMEPSSRTEISTYQPHFMRKYEEMDASPDKTLPIVLLDYVEFAPLFYYAPQQLAARLVFVAWTPEDITGPYYQRLISCCGGVGATADAASFLAAHDRFLIYGNARTLGLVKVLLGAGAKVDVLGATPNYFVARVTYASKAPNPK